VVVERLFALNPFDPSNPGNYGFDIMRQPWLWTAGYILLVALILCCAAMVLSGPPSVALKGASAGSRPVGDTAGAAAAATAPAPTSAPAVTTPTTPIVPARPHDPDAITPARRLRWVLLAAVPSSLMLGVTTYMSTDISAIAMFWVLPLSLYLLSFIFVFMRWPI